MTTPSSRYWESLGEDPRVHALKMLFEQRVGELSAMALPPPESAAVALLERVAADGFLVQSLRSSCPNCRSHLEKADLEVCPECGEAFRHHGGVRSEIVYLRALEHARSVDWVVAIHGMNTSGAWQESFNWHLGTTWGRSVPVAIYKYGIVIAGVVLAWRRNQLREALRDRLARLRDEARARGYRGNPDVVAHSFGTWLIGHLLERELLRPVAERVRFGRVVLTGSILRPDFQWQRFIDAGLVEEVLNHYATGDCVVPFAHATIFDSGPSGRRGFDCSAVINVRASGLGHSDLLSPEHFERIYTQYWRPFLTLPRAELVAIPDRVDPEREWRALPWPLRGTLFPFVALPVLFALLLCVVVAVGRMVEMVVGGLLQLW